MTALVLGYFLGVASVYVAAWTRRTAIDAATRRWVTAPLRELDSADVAAAMRRGRR